MEEGIMSNESDAYEEKVRTVVSLLTNFSALRQQGKIKSGRDNKWFGASLQHHQIDVSIENEHDVLLVDCKYWKNKIPLRACLALLGLVVDISLGPNAKGRTIRGALVSTQAFQPGCKRIVKCYNKRISLYIVNPAGHLGERWHRHYIQLGGPTSLLEDLEEVQENAKKNLEHYKQLSATTKSQKKSC
jgi:hypothetical protein